MNEGQINGRLGWLSATLSAQRNNISKLLMRLRGVVHAGTSLALHRKFMRLMDQVADDREKEMGIIHEIEEVEKRHQELKRLHMLREVDPEAKPKPDLAMEELPEDGEDDEDKDGLFSFRALFGLLWLFSSRQPKPKNPELKVE
jgi:hypothetical protein